MQKNINTYNKSVSSNAKESLQKKNLDIQHKANLKILHDLLSNQNFNNKKALECCAIIMLTNKYRFEKDKIDSKQFITEIDKTVNDKSFKEAVSDLGLDKKQKIENAIKSSSKTDELFEELADQYKVNKTLNNIKNSRERVNSINTWLMSGYAQAVTYLRGSKTQDNSNDPQAAQALSKILIAKKFKDLNIDTKKRYSELVDQISNDAAFKKVYEPYLKDTNAILNDLDNNIKKLYHDYMKNRDIQQQNQSNTEKVNAVSKQKNMTDQYFK